MDETEQELLKKAQAGDARAFERLIAPHIATVRRFSLSLSRGGEADDLAQEALIKAYRSIHTFESRSSLSTWLFTVTRSVAHDRYRSRQEKERRLESELSEVLPGDTESAEALLSAKGDTERLWVLIKRLTPDFRIVLVLSDIEGLSYEEVAKIERIPVGTVRSRLSRARARLRELLLEAESTTSGTPSELSSSQKRSPL